MMVQPDDYAALEAAVGYQFNNRSHLYLAMTHRSFSAQANNERLEFLGDAILDLVISSYLYEHYPSWREGELSQYRAHLVCRQACYQCACQLGLDRALRVGEGERKQGGQLRVSIGADAIEALIAAIYIDGGLPPARQFIIRFFITEPLPSLPELDNYKSQLQEYCQAHQMPLPHYALRRSGPAHRIEFTVQCTVDGCSTCGRGQAGSKRAAEQQAAKQLYHALQAGKGDSK